MIGIAKTNKNIKMCKKFRAFAQKCLPKKD